MLNRLSVIDQTTHQLNTTDAAQMSSDEEVVNAESFPKKPKFKWKRWKNQAWNSNKKSSSQVKPSNTKRTSCDTKMTSPKNKRPKLASPRQCVSTRALENSPSAKIKLNWDTTAMERKEMLELAMNEISAEASCQPHRQQ